MKQNVNEKGFGAIQAIIAVFVGLVILVSFLPGFNTLVATAVASNMSAFLMPSMIQLLLGMLGLIVVALFISAAVNEFSQPTQFRPQ